MVNCNCGYNRGHSGRHSQWFTAQQYLTDDCSGSPVRCTSFQLNKCYPNSLLVKDPTTRQLRLVSSISRYNRKTKNIEIWPYQPADKTCSGSPWKQSGEPLYIPYRLGCNRVAGSLISFRVTLQSTKPDQTSCPEFDTESQEALFTL